MRVVGQGHSFHPETGACRRCGLSTVDPGAKLNCQANPGSPHPRPSGKVPDVYATSKKQQR